MGTRNYLTEGVADTGKSSVCRELRRKRKSLLFDWVKMGKNAEPTNYRQALCLFRNTLLLLLHL
jgi:hypothetical protein